MYPRILQHRLVEVARYYPVLSLTGPRQSGKSTLVTGAFPHLPRVSLEAMDQRSYAREDPRGLLAEHRDGAIIDEVQHVPELLTYLQEEVDRDLRPGRFVLTGSEHLSISERVAQSLAGRAGVLHLLPLSYSEVAGFPSAKNLSELDNVIWTGGYPRIHAHGIPADLWLSDYITNYVQRDVRQLHNISDLSVFTTFLKRCAAQSAQELNLSRLGADTGVSHNTARAWLSLLEASFICFRLPPWTPNIRKQLIKRPKLHFFDTGLLCQLLGIRSPHELHHHPLRGAIFETWVVSEIYKHHLHRGQSPSLQHFRQSRGAEIDLLDTTHTPAQAYEIKSGQTVVAEVIARFAEQLANLPMHFEGHVIHGGNHSHRVKEISLHPWFRLEQAVGAEAE